MKNRTEMKEKYLGLVAFVNNLLQINMVHAAIIATAGALITMYAYLHITGYLKIIGYIAAASLFVSTAVTVIGTLYTMRKAKQWKQQARREW